MKTVPKFITDDLVIFDETKVSSVKIVERLIFKDDTYITKAVITLSLNADKHTFEVVEESIQQAYDYFTGLSRVPKYEKQTKTES